MNQKLYRKIESMTLAEIYTAMYTDPLTRVKNRRAFDEAVAEAAHDQVAIIDLDSLKYLNDETPGGHRTGDEFLASLANTLVSFFGTDSVYRIAGDEFAVLGGTFDNLRGLLERAREVFPGFSFGIGATLPEADTGPNGLCREKRIREQEGLRAGRGACPPWMSQAANYEDGGVEELPIEITGEPRFYLWLSRSTVDALIKLSNAHYDSTCRAASQQGGFLRGWSNMVDLGASPSGSFRELDLTMKLTEGAHQVLNTEELGLIRQYAYGVRTALERAKEITDLRIQL